MIMWVGGAPAQTIVRGPPPPLKAHSHATFSEVNLQ